MHIYLVNQQQSNGQKEKIKTVTVMISAAYSKYKTSACLFVAESLK